MCIRDRPSPPPAPPPPACVQQQDVVIVVERSAYMTANAGAMADFARETIANLELDANISAQVGVVEFADDATLLTNLTGDAGEAFAA
eukprot:3542106-Prymnesium_polylepis.1